MKKNESASHTREDQKVIVRNTPVHSHSDSAIYGIGVIGALFYFLQHAANFSEIIFGIGKAIFWPALVVYQVLAYLQL